MTRKNALFGSGFATNCTGTGDACTGGTCAIRTPPGATSHATPLDAMRAGPAYGSATSRAISGRAAGFAADGAGRCRKKPTGAGLGVMTTVSTTSLNALVVCN